MGGGEGRASFRRLEGPQRAAQPRKSARPYEAGEAGVGTGGRGGFRALSYTSEKGKGAGGANSDDWRESLALCAVYSVV